MPLRRCAPEGIHQANPAEGHRTQGAIIASPFGVLSTVLLSAPGSGLVPGMLALGRSAMGAGRAIVSFTDDIGLGLYGMGQTALNAGRTAVDFWRVNGVRGLAELTVGRASAIQGDLIKQSAYSMARGIENGLLTVARHPLSKLEGRLVNAGKSAMSGLRNVHISEDAISAAIMGGGTNASVDFMLSNGRMSVGGFAQSFALGGLGSLTGAVAGSGTKQWLRSLDFSPSSARLYGDVVGGFAGNAFGYMLDTASNSDKDFSWTTMAMTGSLGAGVNGTLNRVQHSWRVGTQETRLAYSWEREMWSTAFGNLALKGYERVDW